jgi:hypothetical protein
MKRLLISLVVLLVASCGGGDDEPNVCADPTGSYTATVRYTGGTCQVQNGQIGFSIFDDGIVWAVSSTVWGTGSAVALTGASGCFVEVELSTTNAQNETVDTRFILVPDGESVRGALGSVEVTPTSGPSCQHSFELDGVTWIPSSR